MNEKIKRVNKEIILQPGTHIVSRDGRYWNKAITGAPEIVTQIDLPDSIDERSEHTGVVISSGILYPRTNRFLQILREHFIRKGNIVVTFDYAGLGQMGGQSSGSVEAHSVGQMANDLETAILTLKEQTKRKVKNIILIGPSAGGNATATFLNSGSSSCNGIASALFLGTPKDFLTFRNVFEPKTVWEDERTGYYKSSSGAKKPLSIHLWSDSAINNINIARTESLQLPILVIGGGSDVFCPESQLVGINSNSSSRKMIITGGDHNFTNIENELLKQVDAFIESTYSK